MFILLRSVANAICFGCVALTYGDFKLEIDYTEPEPSITISNKGIYVQQFAIEMKAPVKGIG